VARFFVFRFGGRHQIVGPSGLAYTFTAKAPTRGGRGGDAERFLRMGTPESGTYLFRETDAEANPIGIFPPITVENRESHFNPKRFPTDKGIVSAKEWREVTEDLADPWLYYHYTRIKLFPEGRGGYG